jgi:predicted benzoate:H+ symporter BenE
MSTETTDTPLRIDPHPDWLAGVELRQIFDTAIGRSRTGLEQRQRRRERPAYEMTYETAAIAATTAAARWDAVRAETRTPLEIPAWPDAIPLQAGMASHTTVLLDSNPITGEWTVPGPIYLWHPDHGGAFREATVLNGRTITLTGTGTLYPAGSLCFPVWIVVRAAEADTLTRIAANANGEIHRYRTL